MKLINKIYIAVSIFACLILGLAISKCGHPVIRPTEIFIDSPDSIYMARDIINYTQHSALIVVGTVKEVTDPYVIGKSVTLEQDAQVDIEEVLKGEQGIKTVKVQGLADQIEGGYWPEKLATLKGKYGLLTPGEKVLLFIGKETSGRYVVFAGPYGKYLIDGSNNVTSIGEFKTPLGDLETKIKVALKIPFTESKPTDISKEI